MLCAFKNFIKDRTSRSESAGERASIFNRCNDATVRTQEVPLVYVSCDIIALSRTRNPSSNKWYISCGMSGKTYFVDAPLNSLLLLLKQKIIQWVTETKLFKILLANLYIISFFIGLIRLAYIFASRRVMLNTPINYMHRHYKHMQM